jgi:hypothetical protein
MMALTEDGMLDPALVKKRDADYGISTEARRYCCMSMTQCSISVFSMTWLHFGTLSSHSF